MGWLWVPQKVPKRRMVFSKLLIINDLQKHRLAIRFVPF